METPNPNPNSSTQRQLVLDSLAASISANCANIRIHRARASSLCQKVVSLIENLKSVPDEVATSPLMARKIQVVGVTVREISDYYVFFAVIEEEQLSYLASNGADEERFLKWNKRIVNASVALGHHEVKKGVNNEDYFTDLQSLKTELKNSIGNQLIISSILELISAQSRERNIKV
jgi:hypothetical protein